MMKWSEFEPVEQIKNPVVVVLIIHFVLCLPAFLTLRTVDVVRPVVPLDLHPNPSPYGYTWSLLLWGIPALAILLHLWRHPGRALPRKAFLWTVLPLFVLGVILDFFFGNLFFTFPNAAASLEIYAPGWDWSTMSVHWNIPIEEFFFYILGDSVALLVYLWCDMFWLDRYSQANDPYEVNEEGPILRIAWWPVAVGLVVVAAAWAFKVFATPLPGFPGYFGFLVLVATIPAMLFFTKVWRRVNWRAYLSTALTMFFISMLWECTIAFPYGWWDYRPEMMIGLVIPAWSGLPVEEPLLWLLVTFNAVIVYETARAVLGADSEARTVVLGDRWQRKV